MKKKTVLIHSNFCRAFTGFGKNKKNLLRYLYDTGKYNLVELANGLHWNDSQTQNVPWECRGSLPDKSKLEAMGAEDQRAEGYGRTLVDAAVKEFKPDVYIGIEDIWAFAGYDKKSWWDKINTMVWTTLDSLPILQSAIDFAPKVKNYYVWASFAERAMKEIGYDHVKTLRGSLDTSHFYRFSDDDRLKLRQGHGLSNEYIVGFVFRNQLRKSVPNLLDGFSEFKKNVPSAKLLLHTHWSEGWDIPRIVEEKGLNPADILTTYVCNRCRGYSVRPFSGQQQNCGMCGGEKCQHTTHTNLGVSETQLNEIYNLLDVYCHPFTSGGQEIPIQEAKLTELITLATNYSCGEDSVSDESGGIPLTWHEYREPGTQFIKASTDAADITKNLLKVYNMPDAERRSREQKSRQWVIDNFSVEVIGAQLEEIIDKMPPVNYDYELQAAPLNPDYEPKKNYANKEEFLIDIYENILNDKVDKNTQGFKHWMAQLNAGADPNGIVNHFKQVAINQETQKNAPDLKDLLDDDDEGRRLGVVIPEGETDVFLINSLIKNLKKQYKEYNIYFFTKPEYFQYIEDHPDIHKCLPYSPLLENCLALEGVGGHRGLFTMVFYPNTTTQKSAAYIHNGLNTHQFSLS
jgi:glycosyltransferase involved in cell wall biosynthesis